ncbi:hypothetical protein Dimus_036953, partial [Dionaea muscipula]
GSLGGKALGPEYPRGEVSQARVYQDYRDEPVVDEGKLNQNRGLNPIWKKTITKMTTMVEAPAAEEQIYEYEILLKDMMSEARQQKKRKRQAKPVRKSRKSKSPR